MSGHLVARFVHAIWLGSGLFLVAVAAPAAFKAAPNTTVAADLVGAMLMRWHYIALGAPLVLLFLDWRRGRVYVLLVVFAGILLATAEVAADLRIRAIRASTPVPISELPREDPVRRQFGRLHGISTLLLLMQVVAAAVALAVDRDSYESKPNAAADVPIVANANHRGVAPPDGSGGIG